MRVVRALGPGMRFGTHPSGLFRKLLYMHWYKNFFSLAEIESNKILQWAFGALVLGYFVAFSSWMDNTATTIDAVWRGTYTCWPYFQNCADLYFLRTLPDGYSQTFFYMALFGALALAVYRIAERQWELAHATLIPAFLWHGFVTFILTEQMIGNYDYYLFIYGIIILFLPHKEFFLKLALVLFYVLSTVSKMHESWVLGTYFSSLSTGLPLFPDWSIPIWTNFVIFMEMVGAWFLLSKKPLLQRTVFAFFVAFHLYSGILVGYRYPATVMPMLVILFGPMYRHTPVPFTRRALLGWVLVALLFVLQFSPKFIEGDEKLTLEGNKYGLYMFESNHQCVSEVKYIFEDGTERAFREESVVARYRCDPYRYWFRLKNVCERNDAVARVDWRFDHSINGGPFLRIVDVDDACALSYIPFVHNEWIKTEKDNPTAVGRPVENVYE